MAAAAKYDMTVHPTSALVRSQSNGAAAHQVTFPSCDCADFINRRGRLITVDGGIAVTLCKHIVEGLERVGGWNRPPVTTTVHRNLLHGDAMELLRGETVGFSPRESNQVLTAAGRTGSADFKASLTGLLVDGALEYDNRTGHYTLTITR